MEIVGPLRNRTVVTLGLMLAAAGLVGGIAWRGSGDGVDLVEIQASSLVPDGTTHVTLVFDADLPVGAAMLVDHPTDRSSGVSFTTQRSADVGDQLLVCDSTHAFPPPGNRTVDVFVPVDWFAHNAAIEPGMVRWSEDSIVESKIITCELFDDRVQILIWGAASARPADVAVVNNTIAVRIQPDLSG